MKLEVRRTHTLKKKRRGCVILHWTVVDRGIRRSYWLFCIHCFSVLRDLHKLWQGQSCYQSVLVATTTKTYLTDHCHW